MSSDFDLTDDEGKKYSYTAIADGNFILGRVHAWEEARAWLLRDAAKAFAGGDDDRAFWLRKLAATAEQEAQIQRSRYDEHEQEHDPENYARRMKILGRNP